MRLKATATPLKKLGQLVKLLKSPSYLFQKLRHC